MTDSAGSVHFDVAADGRYVGGLTAREGTGGISGSEGIVNLTTGIADRRRNAHLAPRARRGPLRERRPPAVALRRLAPAQRPDEQWHIDLMYVQIQSSWFYLVDIFDTYSRYPVHWTLNPTMTGDTVILTVQQALDGLLHRRPDEPKVVHDSGSQFVSRDWLAFVDAVGVRDIRTRVAHPQSNGVVERVHRTHRQEALLGEATVD